MRDLPTRTRRMSEAPPQAASQPPPAPAAAQTRNSLADLDLEIPAYIRRHHQQ